MRVLVVDDERDLARAVARSIAASGYATDTAFDGEEGLRLAREVPYDAVVLDLLLPKRHGLSVLKELRRAKPDLPILVLSALDRTEERIDGIERGADDYLVKPFAMEELLARLRSVIRRGREHVTSALVRIGAVEVDLARRKILRGGKRVSVGPKEFAVLSYLIHRRGEVVSREEIHEHALDGEFDDASTYVNVLIYELRRKLGPPEVIRTVLKSGYRLVEPGEP